MEVHLKIAGSLMVALGLMHVALPRFFKWNQELSPLNLITKQIVYVHTFFIGFMILLMGVLCIYSSAEIVNPGLGHQISLGLFVFWFTRLIFQFFVYSPKVWRGKKFETTMHFIFSSLWAYFSFVFFRIYWN